MADSIINMEANHFKDSVGKVQENSTTLQQGRVCRSEKKNNDGGLIKRKCMQIYRNCWIGIFFDAMNLAYCITFSLLPELDRNSFNKGEIPNTTSVRIGQSNIFDLVEYTTYAVLALEIAIGCTALGVNKRRLIWLHSSHFHKIDLAVFLLTSLDYVLVHCLGLAIFPFRMLRLFRLLRPMLRHPAFRELRQLLRTLGDGASQIWTVLLVLAFFTAAFALCGAPPTHCAATRHCGAKALPAPRRASGRRRRLPRARGRGPRADAACAKRPPGPAARARLARKAMRPPPLSPEEGRGRDVRPPTPPPPLPPQTSLPAGIRNSFFRGLLRNRKPAPAARPPARPPARRRDVAHLLK